MKAIVLLALGSVLAVAGCKRAAEVSDPSHADGRYLGVGIYAPGPLWPKLAEAKAPPAADAAKIGDDEQIIVVVDSHTGQVRQCGNFSGVCIALDPWNKDVVAGLTAPVKLNPREEAAVTNSGPQTEASGH